MTVSQNFNRCRPQLLEPYQRYLRRTMRYRLGYRPRSQRGPNTKTGREIRIRLRNTYQGQWVLKPWALQVCWPYAVFRMAGPWHFMEILASRYLPDRVRDWVGI
jgi:hypothetical protein